MKVLTKRIFVALSCFILALTAVLLASCGEEGNEGSAMNMNELSKAVKTTATNYLNGRKDFDKFADSTYVFSAQSNDEYSFTLEYKEAATDEDTIEGLVTNKATSNDVVTIYTKQIGEGENKEVAIVVKVQSNHYEKEYGTNLDETLNVSEETTIRDITYYFTKVEASYYCLMIGSQTVKVPNEEDVVTNYKFRTSAMTKEQCSDSVAHVLSTINDDIINFFFESVNPEMLFLGMISAKKQGNDVTISYGYEFTNVSTYNQWQPDRSYMITAVSMSAEMAYKNNNVSTATTNYVAISELSKSETNATITFANGADVTVITELDNTYVEYNDFVEDLMDIIDDLDEIGAMN